MDDALEAEFSGGGSIFPFLSVLFCTIGESTGMANPKYFAAMTRRAMIREIRKTGKDGAVSLM